MTVLPYAVAAVVFAVGIYGVITSRHLVHQILCVSIAQSSTYVLLLAIGFRSGAGPPIFLSAPASRVLGVDPIAQALALTDVVVSAATTALLLARALRVHESGGSTRPQTQRSDSD
ncbi:MAG: cation:proton antiporter subunit C [Candidatus Eremiobacteraeota bacterium]|nr:cation:proton antiporter subunit C [Candidatus Eremiobacteraeota bacterium]